MFVNIWVLNICQNLGGGDRVTFLQNVRLSGWLFIPHLYLAWILGLLDSKYLSIFGWWVVVVSFVLMIQSQYESCQDINDIILGAIFF